MPTYEYRCKECGEQLEVVQAFTDDPLTVCPNCSGELRKVFAVPGISFKGSGFYKTDNRSKKSASATKSSESSTDSGSKSDSSTSSSDSKKDASSTSSSSSGSSDAKTA